MRCPISTVAILLVASAAVAQDVAFVRPDPPGPYLGLTESDFASAKSFGPQDTVLATTYFYWYERHSGVNMRYEDGRSTMLRTPVDIDDYSYLSLNWHKRQLRDCAAAGIDVVLPVYWGDPTHRGEWSFEGVRKLVQAELEMIAAGESPPKIGMFHACISLEWGPEGKVDLRTPFGREWNYTIIRDFWAMVPPQLWAMVDGQPIIMLYNASFAAAHDQSCVEHVRREFAKDFAGRDPYIIRGDGWNVDTESQVTWGVAAYGPSVLPCAAVGPGYDDSVVPGRAPLIVDREGGAFYRRSWEKLLWLPPTERPRIVHIETWNELHEGTEICETREFGRHYIEMTRKYGDMYREGVQLPRSGPFASAHTVVWCAPGPNVGQGLRLLPQVGDGPSEPSSRGGEPCRVTTRNPYDTCDYLYFDLDDSFAFWETDGSLDVTVTYYDEGAGLIHLHYDSRDPEGSIVSGAFKFAEGTEFRDTRTWRSYTFHLPDPRCTNRTHGGDFRLASRDGPMAIGRVSVQRTR
jgi:hypothetical protein